MAADVPGSDDDVKAGETKLSVVNDNAATLVAEGAAINQGLLNTAKVYLLDSGSEIFVWIGKASVKADRTNGMTLAGSYLQVSFTRIICSALHLICVLFFLSGQ
jgi:hypothetical protein